MKKLKKIPLSRFDYNLPSELISQEPIKPRDHARLLILDKKSGKLEHKKFYDIIDYLSPGDVLVLNNSKVIPARLLGKKETGGKVEVFLLQKQSPKHWQCLIGGKIKPGQKVLFKNNIIATPSSVIPDVAERRSGIQDVIATPIKKLDEQSWLVKFNCSDKKIFSVGETPLPPYIKKKSKDDDYQTVYAKPSGSVAAPTAGLHFTKKLIEKLKKKGIKIEYITLHVGLGTFAPVKSDYIEDHKIHSELAILDKSTASRLNKAKQKGSKIFAVGTTSVRTLEAFTCHPRLDLGSKASSKIPSSQGGINPPLPKGRLEGFAEDYPNSPQLIPQTAWVDIFIYPGYSYKFVDGIITNFHLPKSTLLMLISAFASEAQIKSAYQEAIKQKYKFFSFGDAMLIK